MNVIYLIIFFILGTLMGSFFTVVGLRLPKNENFIMGRSHCDSCGHELKLYEMIPIFSYLFQCGKCRYCKAKIGIMPLFMEFFCGIFFLTAFFCFGFSYRLLIALGIVSLLMIIVVSDITYLIIPDEVLVFFGCYFLIIQIFASGWKGAIYHIITGLFLFVLIYIIMIFGNKLFKKESLGGGDIKLMFLFGLVLDPLLGSLSIFLGSLFALPLSFYLLWKHNERIIPFGPFLLIALTFIYFTQITSGMVISLLGF